MQTRPLAHLWLSRLTALLCACLFGVPAVLGRGRSVLELAAGSPVVGARPERARTD